jgi:hypothetical protein
VRAAVIELYEMFIRDIGDLVKVDENDSTPRDLN